MNAFLVPRVFAALSAALLVAAAVTAAFGVYGWHASAGVLLAAGCIAWLSHGMCETIRDARRDVHRFRRLRLRPRSVRLITPPLSESDWRDPYCECGAHVKGTPCYLPELRRT